MALAACAAVYVALCVWSLHGHPPLSFADDLDLVARISISDWYEKKVDLPRDELDIETVVYAIIHPRNPFLYRPSVSYGGLGGEGTIMVSYMNYVAIFVEQDGRWIFLRDQTA
jgi:hypothetical protein